MVMTIPVTMVIVMMRLTMMIMLCTLVYSCKQNVPTAAGFDTVII